MYIEVHVDEREVLENLSDDDLLEELKSRGYENIDDGISESNLNGLYEIWRYKGEQAVLKELSNLIYEQVGKIV